MSFLSNLFNPKSRSAYEQILPEFFQPSFTEIEIKGFTRPMFGTQTTFPLQPGTYKYAVRAFYLAGATEWTQTPISYAVGANQYVAIRANIPIHKRGFLWAEIAYKTSDKGSWVLLGRSFVREAMKSILPVDIMFLAHDARNHQDDQYIHWQPCNECVGQVGVIKSGFYEGRKGIICAISNLQPAVMGVLLPSDFRSGVIETTFLSNISKDQTMAKFDIDTSGDEPDYEYIDVMNRFYRRMRMKKKL